MSVTIKILLADDHRITREGLRRMLNDQPELKVVAETGNGRAAVELAAELSPDVIIMDVTMPQLNGVEATRQVRGQNPNIKVVVLSMHVERQFVTEMLSAGAGGYLLKDCPFEELVRAIREVSAGGTYLSPKVQEVVVKGYVGAENPAKRYAESLSPREREVIQLVAEGRSIKEIAKQLHLSPKTVETHRRQGMSKLNVGSVAELTHYAIREGMTSLQ